MSTSSLLNLRVRTLRYEADGVMSVELVPVSGTQLPPFTPGAHIDLHLANGIVRSYSLVNDCDERDRYVLGILSDPGSRGGSRYVHEQLRVGAVINVSAPRNHFALDETAEHTALVAGGIGVTPILCMARRLRKLGRTAHLVYCARSRAQAGFIGELQALAGGALEIEFHFDDEHGGAPLDLKVWLARHPVGAHAYCCGPGPMLLAFEHACEANRIADVHLERFSADTSVARETSESYTVELKKSGKTFEVPPGKTLLDTLLEAGIDANYSCMEGVCGSCETRVLSGCPDHRDSILSAREHAEGKIMMICVSGAKAGETLVLDL